ncbi:DUF1203 domain-containing protein [Streptomyces sp. NPDC055078]
MTTTATKYPVRPIETAALDRLRVTDDAGNPCAPYTDPKGGAPLRCCLRTSRAGESIALVSYAPLRRWAAERGAHPGAYDEQGPVFIHAEPCEGPRPGAGYPFARTGAQRTLRRYDTEGRITGGRLLTIPEAVGAAVPEAVGAAVPEAVGEAFDAALDEAFADPAVALVHIRALEQGCFHFEVRRSDSGHRD